MPSAFVFGLAQPECHQLLLGLQIPNPHRPRHAVRGTAGGDELGEVLQHAALQTPQEAVTDKRQGDKEQVALLVSLSAYLPGFLRLG